MSTFSGLNRAASALYASQRGLDVTGQNISNVNTDGYSRQRADLQSIGGSTVPAIWSTSNDIGQGVTAEHVTRIRDVFLETRAQTERASSAQLLAESEALTQVEGAFREPGPFGIQKLLSDVWKGWGDVHNKPEDLAARGALLEKTNMLAAGIRTTRATMDQQWTDTRENLQILVGEANTDAAQVADLNEAIKRATMAGLPSHELADKRDVLVQKLAASVGAVSTRAADGMVNVVVGGTAVVSGTVVLNLRLVAPADPEATLPPPPAPQLGIVAEPGDWPVGVGGTAAGHLAALGPAAPQGSSIKTYRQQLDGFAATLATTINQAHDDGYDLTGAPGGAMLRANDGSATITAKNIDLAFTSREQIAAAKHGLDANGKPSWDGENARALSMLGAPSNGPDAQYRSLVVNLGVRSSVASRDVAIQNVITAQVDRARESVSGVSLDEEMTNMLAFQHAYAAAGRLVTAIDETLDVLINRTGLVGR